MHALSCNSVWSMHLQRPCLPQRNKWLSNKCFTHSTVFRLCDIHIHTYICPSPECLLREIFGFAKTKRPGQWSFRQAPPYHIAQRGAACIHMCSALARTCTVSRGGPRGGQRGKDFSPPKMQRRLHCTTPRVALDPLQRRNGPGLASTLFYFSYASKPSEKI